jgi:hypothetical protein
MDTIRFAPARVARMARITTAAPVGHCHQGGQDGQDDQDDQSSTPSTTPAHVVCIKSKFDRFAGVIETRPMLVRLGANQSKWLTTSPSNAMYWAADTNDSNHTFVTTLCSQPAQGRKIVLQW